MSIHVALNHVTHYRYDRAVVLSPQVVRLRPAPHSRTRILSYSLRVAPANHFINWMQDPFANHLARLVFPERTREFKVTVDLVAEMSVFNPFDFFLEPEAEKFPFAYAADTAQDLVPYLARMPATPLFQALVDSIPRAPMRTIDFLVSINQRLQSDIAYLIRMEPGVQTPEHTLTTRSGSCRDSAWLMVQLLRHLGLAARFVSGYLIQLKADVKSLDGPSGTEIDFTDLHAWCEVFLPGAGWIGLDPTSGLLAGEGHIPVACTPEPGTAAPISGELEDCEVTFSHHMAVERIHESARVTLPYSDAQWNAILALGDTVDARLQQGDVRLTMGGEPTFVSVDDRDGAEWNTAALGPTKRGFAAELVHKLAGRYGAGGFLHFGQGKWYPGEQLPRWALTTGWRTDGQPCWRDPLLFADERDPQTHTSDDARRFVQALAGRLGLDTRYAMAAHEDAGYYLWREGKLPSNVDVLDARLGDEMERARLRRVFAHGLAEPVGYVLPLARDWRVPPDIASGQPVQVGGGSGGAGMPGSGSGAAWVTSRWHLRDGRLWLVQGDSPMGWRLPLDSIAWSAPADLAPPPDLDPFAPRGALPPVMRSDGADPFVVAAEAAAEAKAEAAREGKPGVDAAADAEADEAPARGRSAVGVVRTALCVEVRDPRRADGAGVELKAAAAAERDPSTRRGQLYVFLPPLKHLEDFLTLLAAIEDSAAACGTKVVLEGYGPPRDARLQTLAVTPDPGVVEVNIHPASSWRQLVEHTEFLYDAAHRTRLTTEKFMIDGRHTGTGGGNHFVLGGASAADSPFLRRPDLLGSLIGYWHNHPSLSYLFSGLFIGPTSQAPRIDEARNDQVYEVEIALAEIDRLMGLDAPGAGAPAAGAVPWWTIDRLLRNLLVDVTGNTHRSEFCIDKLYSPDGPTGRLGLLELRAFEMPPHARMSLAQQLLLRALLAWFWQQPYRGGSATRLTRWGTGLHDRFLLPHFVEADFADVVADLNRAGFAFDAAWFAPHMAFRFPTIGEVAVGGVELTLRTALEPWHVMGEEGSSGGTVRYVDSSLERLEVRVTGLDANRHLVSVNGRALPLQPTGRDGEFVCGVRYKAWEPPSALHPTIKSHAPLTFDLVDRSQGRSLGGCRYHVAHPGGRNHETFPVNSFEAESRRLARFFRFGHTPGPLVVGEAAPSREFPFTLDLRRPA